MFDINSNVLLKTGLTARQLQTGADAVRSNNGFNNFQAFVDAENNYGISSLYLLAHACEESAWGTSEIAPNNLFGFNADDANPVGDASSFISQAACIDYVARFIKINYLTPGGVDYNGTTLHDIFERYSSSHDVEATTVAQIMSMVQGKIPSVPMPTPIPAPPQGNTLTIQAGDTFWGLEAKNGWTHGTLESLNPGVNPVDLHIGQLIRIPGAPASHQPTKYVIKQGDTFWALESSRGLPHGTLQALNPGVNPTKLQIGEVINL